MASGGWPIQARFWLEWGSSEVSHTLPHRGPKAPLHGNRNDPHARSARGTDEGVRPYAIILAGDQRQRVKKDARCPVRAQTHGASPLGGGGPRRAPTLSGTPVDRLRCAYVVRAS